MKRCTALLICFLSAALTPTAFADEGMWLLPNLTPSIVKRLDRLEFMRVSDLANANEPSFKDAVVKLSTGCTGSIVSRSGIVLTNHHCISNALQQIGKASPALTDDGFYAATLADEVHVEGMTVALPLAMLDITGLVRDGVSPNASIEEQQAQIGKNIARILDTATQHEGVEAYVAPQFAENRYTLISQRIFRDVRLVLAPPANIGKFGGDTDNWQYPSQTGDFAFLRIYANASNEPADFSPQNQPYKPTQFLSISPNGYQEGDLSLIVGYPAVTQRYATAEEIAFDRDFIRKAQIEVWSALIPIWDSIAAKNPSFASFIYPTREVTANYLKYYSMQRDAINADSILQQREAFSNAFRAWYSHSPSLEKKYSSALHSIHDGISAARNAQYQATLLREALRWGMPITQLAARFSLLDSALKANDKESIAAFKRQLNEASLDPLYTPSGMRSDSISTGAMLGLCLAKLPRRDWPTAFTSVISPDNVALSLDKAYAKSFFASKDRLLNFLNNPTLKKLKKDHIYQLASSMQQELNSLQQRLSHAQTLLRSGHQRYLEGLLEQYSDSVIYPDADGTLRISYGRVRSISASDGTRANFYSTLADMERKSRSGAREYQMNPSLKHLYDNRAFSGFQLDDGQMPVNFITTNDIIGGNSGSPVINATGDLIGLAFDGNEDGILGLYAFNRDNARSICVDIRFILLYTKIQRNLRIFNELSIYRKSSPTGKATRK